MNRPPAIVSVLVLGACNAVLALDERPPRQTESTTTATAGGATGGAPTCGGACEADVPAGWSGPTAVQTGATALACETANVELSLTDELAAAPAECACDCAAAVGVDCDAAAVAVTTYFNSTCTNGDETGAGTVGQCINLCCSARSANYVKPTPDVSAASCDPITVSNTVPPVSWGSHLIGCGPVPLSDCGGERCFEKTADHNLCIYQSGTHDCPEGPFSERAIGYADHEDSRACEPCGCGAVDTADCNEVVVGYAILDCNLGATVIAPAPGCTEPDLDFDGARIQSVNPTGSCAMTGGAPLGEATAVSPTTVCCIE